MKSILLLILFLFSCGKSAHKSFQYGKTSSAHLVELKGNPIRIEDEKNVEIYVYENNEKYQIEKGVVTHGLKDPEGDEKTLLYWKHKFKDCDTETKKLAKTESHGPQEYQISCASMGITVTYFDGSSYISRVVEYEKK